MQPSSDVGALHPEYHNPCDEAYELETFTPGAHYSEFTSDPLPYPSEGLLDLFNSPGATYYLPLLPEDVSTAEGSPVSTAPASTNGEDWVNDFLHSSEISNDPDGPDSYSLFSPARLPPVAIKDEAPEMLPDAADDLWSYERGLQRMSSDDF